MNFENQEFVTNFVASLKTSFCNRKAFRNIHSSWTRRQLLKLLKINLKTGELFFLKAGTSAGHVRFNSAEKQARTLQKKKLMHCFQGISDWESVIRRL